jgi:glycerol-3-phosphate dehydrogenase (NAD(P)+)
MAVAGSGNSDRALSRHHDRARRRGVNRLVYWIVRGFLQPAIHIWFRPSRLGREHIPKRGPVLLAANHRSFLDPFIVGICMRRPVYFVAKRELFAKRWQGWLLNALGAFPVRRGESDEEMMETARAILNRGDAVVIFPEGTRIRTGSLGKPKRGVGRLALETGAPVVPIALAGTERARRGWRIRPVKVRLRCGRPLAFPRVEHASPALAAAVTERIWPCVELQWEWLGGLPPLRKAAVVGAGEMGTALAAALGRAGLEVQLGCRTARQADRIAAARRNPDAFPHLELPKNVTPCTVADIEFAGVDLVALATPLAALPAVAARIGEAVGERTTLLLPARGQLRQEAALPARYLAERTRAGAVAMLGVPNGAASLVRPLGRVDLRCDDDDRRRQLVEAFEAAGIDVHREAALPEVVRRVA